ncbi:hypothetical protein KAR48_09865 [bacterium]|nr:hypothetical protein [bacterium]
MSSINEQRHPMKVITRSDIVKHFSMVEAIASMAEAFKALADGTGEVPHRYVTDLNEGALTFLFKPASIKGADQSSIKMLTQKNGYTVPGVPTITGVVMLLDNTSGEILALMDGETITAMRTGAASGLATQCLSREASEVLALFGCGSQGKTQVEAVAAVREIKKIWLFDTVPESAKHFMQEMQPRLAAHMALAPDLSVLKEADIICTATNSTMPLFDKTVLKPGVHINAIGSFKPTMRELHPEVVRSARVYLDDAAACLNESGDLVGLFATEEDRDRIVQGEIGAYLLNQIEGRVTPQDVTLFKSVGNAIQDFVVARKIYMKSKEEGFGRDIHLFD